MFDGASKFNQDISDWNTNTANNLSNMFIGASSTSENKGLIHAILVDPNWPYDWSMVCPTRRPSYQIRWKLKYIGERDFCFRTVNASIRTMTISLIQFSMGMMLNSLN